MSNGMDFPSPLSCQNNVFGQLATFINNKLIVVHQLVIAIGPCLIFTTNLRKLSVTYIVYGWERGMQLCLKHMLCLMIASGFRWNRWKYFHKLLAILLCVFFLLIKQTNMTTFFPLHTRNTLVPPPYPFIQTKELKLSLNTS